MADNERTERQKRLAELEKQAKAAEERQKQRQARTQPGERQADAQPTAEKQPAASKRQTKKKKKPTESVQRARETVSVDTSTQPRPERQYATQGLRNPKEPYWREAPPTADELREQVRTEVAASIREGQPESLREGPRTAAETEAAIRARARDEALAQMAAERTGVEQQGLREEAVRRARTDPYGGMPPPEARPGSETVTTPRQVTEKTRPPSERRFGRGVPGETVPQTPASMRDQARAAGLREAPQAIREDLTPQPTVVTPEPRPQLSARQRARVDAATDLYQRAVVRRDNLLQQANVYRSAGREIPKNLQTELNKAQKAARNARQAREALFRAMPESAGEQARRVVEEPGQAARRGAERVVEAGIQAREAVGATAQEAKVQFENLSGKVQRRANKFVNNLRGLGEENISRFRSGIADAATRGDAAVREYISQAKGEVKRIRDSLKAGPTQPAPSETPRAPDAPVTEPDLEAPTEYQGPNKEAAKKKIAAAKKVLTPYLAPLSLGTTVDAATADSIEAMRLRARGRDAPDPVRTFIGSFLNRILLGQPDEEYGMMAVARTLQGLDDELTADPWGTLAELGITPFVEAYDTIRLAHAGGMLERAEAYPWDLSGAGAPRDIDTPEALERMEAVRQDIAERGPIFTSGLRAPSNRTIYPGVGPGSEEAAEGVFPLWRRGTPVGREEVPAATAQAGLAAPPASLATASAQRPQSPPSAPPEPVPVDEDEEPQAALAAAPIIVQPGAEQALRIPPPEGFVRPQLSIPEAPPYIRFGGPGTGGGYITPPVDAAGYGLRGPSPTGITLPQGEAALPGTFADRVQASIDAGAYDPVSPQRIASQQDANERITRGIGALRDLRAANLGVPVEYLDPVASGMMRRGEIPAAAAAVPATAGRGMRGALTENQAFNVLQQQREEGRAAAQAGTEALRTFGEAYYGNSPRIRDRFETFAATWRPTMPLGSTPIQQMQNVRSEFELRRILEEASAGMFGTLFGLFSPDTTIEEMTNPNQSVTELMQAAPDRWWWDRDNFVFTVRDRNGEWVNVEIDEDNDADGLVRQYIRRMTGMPGAQAMRRAQGMRG